MLDYKPSEKMLKIQKPNHNTFCSTCIYQFFPSVFKLIVNSAFVVHWKIFSKFFFRILFAHYWNFLAKLGINDQKGVKCFIVSISENFTYGTYINRKTLDLFKSLHPSVHVLQTSPFFPVPFSIFTVCRWRIVLQTELVYSLQTLKHLAFII